MLNLEWNVRLLDYLRKRSVSLSFCICNYSGCCTILMSLNNVDLPIYIETTDITNLKSIPFISLKFVCVIYY